MAANGGIPVVATVQAPRATGVTSITVDTLQYWPTGTGIKFSTFKLDTNNKVIAGSQADWKGVSNGSNQLTNIQLVGGLTLDPGNAIGDKVRMGPTAQWAEDMAEAFLSQHSNPNGAHTAITATSLATTNDVNVGGNFSVTGTPTFPASSITSAFINWPSFNFDTATSATTSTTGTTEVTIATKSFTTVTGRKYLVLSQIYQVRQSGGGNVSYTHRLYAGGTVICTDGGAVGSFGDRTVTAIGTFTATGTSTTINNTLQATVSGMSLNGSSIFVVMVG